MTDPDARWLQRLGSQLTRGHKHSS